MIIFSILGFTIGLEETIIFVPIGIIIARTLGYDALTGVPWLFWGASGFSGGMLNPFTVGVAQTVVNFQCFQVGAFELSYIFYISNGHFNCNVIC